VSWTWRDRLPRGAVALLAGQAGLGKSTLTLELAARLTRGELAGDLLHTPSSVLIVTFEDHLASVVVPRLLAADADLRRIEFVAVKCDDGTDGLLTFPDDLPLVETKAVELGARLLIVDPVVAALSGSIDGNRDQSIRRALAPLAALSERCDLSTVAVVHLNKQQADLLSRVGGSVGFVGAARSVLAFARDPEDPEGDAGSQRIVLHAKSNWGALAPTLAARIEGRTVQQPNNADTIATSRLIITGTSSVTVEQFNRSSDDAPARDVEEAILAALADGPQPSREVKPRVAAELGISRRTIERASTRLARADELIVTEGGFPRTTTWELPPAVAPPPVTPHPTPPSGATENPPANVGALGHADASDAARGGTSEIDADAHTNGTTDDPLDAEVARLAAKFPDLAALVTPRAATHTDTPGEANLGAAESPDSAVRNFSPIAVRPQIEAQRG
jgi:hypothetical protein